MSELIPQIKVLAVVKQDLGIHKLYEVPKSQKYLISDGDEVIVEFADDDVKHGEVVAIESGFEDEPWVRFALKAFHEEFPLKRVLTKIEYITMDWEEEEDGKTSEKTV